MSKIGKGEWLFILVIVGVIDFVQFFVIEGPGALIFGLGPVANEVIDPIIGVITAAYLQLRGVDILVHPKRLLWLIGTEAAAAITGGVVQAWIIAIYFIYKDVQNEEAAMKASMQAPGGPPNQKGMRRPKGRSAPFYENGVGRPRGNRGGPVMIDEGM